MNELIGTDLSKLPSALDRLMVWQWEKGAILPKWDGGKLMNWNLQHRKPNLRSVIDQVG
jgi:hypothetical protein